MRASHNRSGKEAMIVTAEELTSLHDVVSSYADGVRITTTCADGIERTPDDVNELLAYENPPARELREIRLYGKSNEREKSVRLRLSNNKMQSYDLDIEGAEDSVSQLAEAIQDKIIGMRPWYSFAARTNLFGFGVSITLFLLGASIILSKILPDIQSSEPSTPETWQHNVMLVAITYALLFGPPVVGFVLDRLKSRIFPMVTFAIGQGLKRHKTRELLQTIVILGFIVSLVAGLVAYGITRIG